MCRQLKLGNQLTEVQWELRLWNIEPRVGGGGRPRTLVGSTQRMMVALELSCGGRRVLQFGGGGDAGAQDMLRSFVLLFIDLYEPMTSL